MLQIYEYNLGNGGGYQTSIYISSNGKILDIVHETYLWTSTTSQYNPNTHQYENTQHQEIGHDFKLVYLNDKEDIQQSNWSIFILDIEGSIESCIPTSIYHVIKYIGSMSRPHQNTKYVFAAQQYTEKLDPKPSDTRLAFIDE